MGSRKKGRRKIAIEDVQYLWWVADNHDGIGHVLHITSQDKKFIVMYPLYDEIEINYLVVLGKTFANAETGGSWKRFECPCFDEALVIRPSNVRALVLWCLDTSIERKPHISPWYWPL